MQYLDILHFGAKNPLKPHHVARPARRLPLGDLVVEEHRCTKYCRIRGNVAVFTAFVLHYTCSGAFPAVPDLHATASRCNAHWPAGAMHFSKQVDCTSLYLVYNSTRNSRSRLQSNLVGEDVFTDLGCGCHVQQESATTQHLAPAQSHPGFSI